MWGSYWQTISLLAITLVVATSAVNIKVYKNGEWSGAKAVDIPDEACANGGSEVPALVCSTLGIEDDACTLYSEYGTVVSTCAELRTFPFFSIVTSKQRFMFTPFELGRETELADMIPLGRPVVLKAISQKPKVFEILNFFDEADADFLITNALSIKDEVHRLKRSTTGSENVLVDRKRTSESAFDVSSSVAMKLKRRTQEMLRYSPYDETVMDGFQVLRYNVSGAYNSHFDYIESSTDSNYDTVRGGTNRFATVLFYLNTVEEGGETVFPSSPTQPEFVHMVVDNKKDEDSLTESVDVVSSVSGDSVKVWEERKKRIFALSDIDDFLMSKNVSSAFPEHGFERPLLVQCRTKLASRPVKLRAILFYSMLPNLQKDIMSLHAGCPVVKGEKWLANLWIWNGPRHEFWEDEQGTVNGKVGALRPRAKGVLANPRAKTEEFPVAVSFEAKGVVGAHLFWAENDWGELIPGFPLRSNSFAGHKWTARLDGNIVKTFVVPNKRHRGEHNFFLLESDLEGIR